MGRKCHDCGVGPGQNHKFGCDVERCPFCGGQLISCSCIYLQLGERFGWEYKHEICVLPEKEGEVEIPEGYKLECDWPHMKVYYYPFNGLPEEIYCNGPTDEMAELWGEMLEEQGRMKWTGKWPGEEDCERLGFWQVSAPGGGFKSVDKDYPGASHDLNRLYKDARWNSKKKIFELREEEAKSERD